MIKQYRYILLLIILICNTALCAQDDAYTINQVKTIFLGKFSHFVTWPENSAINNSTTTFVIGIIGNDTFNGLADKIYKNERIKNKPVEIRYITELKDIDGCNLLFISKSEKKNLDDILAYTADKPILTIGDTRGYMEAGVLINFDVINNNICFDISFVAIEKTGLNFNYKLLNMARKAYKEGGRQ